MTTAAASDQKKLEQAAARIDALTSSARIDALRERMLAEPRFMSIEQARIITRIYKENEGEPVILKRALALKAAMEELEITLDPDELIVGNRSKGVRAGIVFPESGISWIDKEIESLPTRPQDRFQVRPEDIAIFREEILPYWRGRTLEDRIQAEAGESIAAIAMVAKINQKDHAQGHICPDVKGWIEQGPAGLRAKAEAALAALPAASEKADFYRAVILVLEGACRFMRRYAELAEALSFEEGAADKRENLLEIARVCRKLAQEPAASFREAVQSLWFLFVLLHMESNASSFSPGRADQYLYPYYEADLEAGRMSEAEALEIVECLWLKFNQVVYLRNAHSARYFAGFPIGFNLALGGQHGDGSDASNALSFICLKAQEHLGLPQPNLSARVHPGSPHAFLKACVKVLAKGSGMPQFFNDKAVVPALIKQDIEAADALDYAIVGCVELSTTGNNLGWSDAAMFNLCKALELTLNNGKCLLSGKQMGLDLGELGDFESYEQLESAFAKQIDHFIGEMIKGCEVVERFHQELLPSPFLSSVISPCLEVGVDVTAGGAKYNLSGIQIIQGANIADSLAAIKRLVYEEKRIGADELMAALRADFAGHEKLRRLLMNRAPKYGNDIPEVDILASQWIRYFNSQLCRYRNYRGGRYHTGLYTVSAHVPMGQNVGASPDGRKAREPLADGGMSPVYGRDIKGPTAVLKSVSRIPSEMSSNGGLLNMKFLPEFFTEQGVEMFVLLLRSFVELSIPHIQFNVLRQEDLRAAQAEPERYRSMTVRVAGYTAYFTELSEDLQNEIIARTSYERIN